MKQVTVGALILVGFLAVALFADEAALKYPATKKGAVVETLHGVKVADPYRWLEGEDERESKAVAAWVAEENTVTNAYLDAIPARKKIRARLTELWNYPRYSVPFKAGQRYFFLKNNGLQNQPVLNTLDKLDGEPRVLLDPNTWSKDGTIARGEVSASEDGKYLAYSVAEAGSDWNTWRVIAASGTKLDDELKWTKFTATSWTPDGKGFFYSRYEEPKEGAKFKGVSLNQKVYYHTLGSKQSEDRLVYRRTDHPDWDFMPTVTEDGKYLVITTFQGTDERYRITWLDLTKKDAEPVELIDNFDQEYSFLSNDGSVFYFKTNLDAPRKRVISIDVTKPTQKNWKEIVPQEAESLQSVSLVGNQFIAQYLKDARSLVKRYGLNGKLIGELELPGLCTAEGFGGKKSDEETFYRVDSFTAPGRVYRLDLKSGKATLFRKSDVKFNPDDYEVNQVFYTSKDGTKVPMFIAHKKGLKRDGSNPTLLYGYGGFNVSLTPEFSPARLAWMEMGGIYAQPSLRGGGEYGEPWHKAGTKLKKQNVFDDFIAAAEYLIKEKYTRTERLAIKGESNGGLLVGACMTQRPDLFGACLPGVGVMDMLRFHMFTAGRYWVDDYGSAENAAEFKALYAYSPYHNLKQGVKYPATLVLTADTDDRVIPAHSFKFIARLQECQAGSAPVLARIETRAGHGAGKPTAKRIEELADEWAFLVKNLRMEEK